jgi:hypothetical protein
VERELILACLGVFIYIALCHLLFVWVVRQGFEVGSVIVIILQEEDFLFYLLAASHRHQLLEFLQLEVGDLSELQSFLDQILGGKLTCLWKLPDQDEALLHIFLLEQLWLDIVQEGQSDLDQELVAVE